MSLTFTKLYLNILPSKISLFRFLLEGYDGLAVLTTIDVKRGLVRLLIPESRIGEFWKLLDAICQELSAKQVNTT